MSTATEIHNKVKAYFDAELQQGNGLFELIDRFRDGPLPTSLLTGDKNEELSLRRWGQIIGSQFIKQKQQESEVGPYEMTNSGLED